MEFKEFRGRGGESGKKKEKKKKALGNLREGSTWEVKVYTICPVVRLTTPGCYFSQDVLNTY